MAAMVVGVAPAAVAYAGGTPAPSETGGSEYGAALAKVHPVRPVASVFTSTRRSSSRPGFRACACGSTSRAPARARAARVPPADARRRVVRVDAGSIPTGKRLAVTGRRAASSRPAPTRCSYRPRPRQRRPRPQRARLGQDDHHRPRPGAAAPPPPHAPVAPGTGVFPVAGAHTYGDGSAPRAPATPIRARTSRPPRARRSSPRSPGPCCTSTTSRPRRAGTRAPHRRRARHVLRPLSGRVDRRRSGRGRRGRPADLPRRPHGRRDRPAPALRDLGQRLAREQRQHVHRSAAGPAGLGPDGLLSAGRGRARRARRRSRRGPIR